METKSREIRPGLFMQSVLTCDDEHGLAISNVHESQVWLALEKLVWTLWTDSNFTSEENLVSWKNAHHLSVAKELYAWRAVIEEIKNSDLITKCSGSKDDGLYELMIDKPAMLKISGEITTALMHSYNQRHKITFNQKVSKVPS